MIRAPHLAFLAATLFGATPALAQDSAAAEALFKKGVDEMTAGHFDVACPAIAESQRLDPRPGTLFTLAECEAKAGKIATALVHYEDYLHLVDTLPDAQKQRHAQRADIAKAQRKALSPEVPTLTLAPPKDAPADLKVTRDGTELSAASLGVALPVDPGEHVIVTSAGNGPKTEQRITLAKRDKKTLDLRFEKAGAGAPAPTATSDSGPPPAGDTGPSKQRIAAYVTGGVGIAALALGGVTGGLALAQKGTVDASCPNKVCNAEGLAALDQGRTMGLVSTVGFGVGAAGVIAAVVLLVTDKGSSKPKSVDASLDAGPSGGMLRLKGAF